MDKEYIVTLKSKDDLEDFYTEMSSNGFKLSKKRPISRNTHYHMTAEQAEELKADSRVVDVEEVTDRMIEIPQAIYNNCLLYTSPSPRDGLLSRMPSSA